jgi:UDP-N-acetylmuramoyl-L-alanyl-D-glutamate--2,6-diaminopimelate ligase
LNVTLGSIADRLAHEGVLAEPISDESRAIEIADLTTDSRAVREGSLFCAVRGTAGDGHRFLADAAHAGAWAALVEEREPTLAFELEQLRVTSGREAASWAAAEFFGDPWNDLTLIGITGTNGKTTSAAILRHLLSSRKPSASIGTLGAVASDGRVIPGTEGLTTPGPIDICRWLRRLSDGGVRAVAMEVSSHALDQDRARAARFDAALFTNLTRDHLDYHGTFGAYRAAKLKLIGLLKEDGAAVLNADDISWVDADTGSAREVRFGITSPADVRAEDVSFGGGRMEWTLRTPTGSAHVELPLLGLFNVSNALGAAAVLWSLGWDEASIAEGLASLPQVPGRLERVPTPTGAPTVLIDFAHTPDALERALGAVRPLVSGELVAVFGAGGDRDRGKRPEMGRVAAALADRSVVTSDNPRTEDPESILDDIERGMGRAPRRRILDRREAIRFAVESASADDLVLLAGKGHETYQIWGTEKHPFDERDVVAELFAGKALPA